MIDESVSEQTIEVVGLLELIRKHAEDKSWCETAESVASAQLGIQFQPVRYRPSCGCCRARDGAELRFTPIEGAAATVTRATVIAMIHHVRREWPGRARDLILDIAKAYDLDVTPPYRVRVTVMLDAEELEGEGSGWPTGEHGEPTELTDEALRWAARDAVMNLVPERLKVSVAR